MSVSAKDLIRRHQVETVGVFLKRWDALVCRTSGRVAEVDLGEFRSLLEPLTRSLCDAEPVETGLAKD